MYDDDGEIARLVNNYEKISFNFGPTLMSWIQKYSPYVYQAILEADRLSVKRFSDHGNAIAQAYNHMIMPLANRQDKITQVIWGISDFEMRFGRKPEGMWLPETAVDLETLEIMCEKGIQFTILSPRQAKRVRLIGESEWRDVSDESIDTTMPYLVKFPTGRGMNIFFYNGGISHNIAFGEILKSGEELASCLLKASGKGKGRAGIIHVATDGETFGHHHRFGEMALAYCLDYIESNNLAEITNYGKYLEKYPPTHQVEIFDNSSWSCAHGIERWRGDCGCNSGMNGEWNQKWRRPLRDAMDWLRDTLVDLFSDVGSKYFKDPWDVRNEYIEVILDRSPENKEAFLKRHTIKALSADEMVKAIKLLEIQRNAMLMYTSCGWFFDDISGVETIQIMQYASRAIQYAEELRGVSLEDEFLRHLDKAPSNVLKSGAEVYEVFVTPEKSNLFRVGGQYAISSLFEEYPEKGEMYCYTVERELSDKIDVGSRRLILGKAKITSNITGEEETISYAALYQGDQDVTAGVKDSVGDDGFSRMQKRIKRCFEKGDISEVIGLMHKEFGGLLYSLRDLCKEKQEKILNQIIQVKCEEVESSYRYIYENSGILDHFHSLRQPLPSPFFTAAEYIINGDLKKIFEENKVDCEKLKRLIDDAGSWAVDIESMGVGFVVSSWISSVMEGLKDCSEDIRELKNINTVLDLIKPLSLPLDLWKAQNVYLSIKEREFSALKVNSESGDHIAKRWLELFLKLGSHLNIKE
ncbi:MAG: glycoside hydrolase [Candidatus Scalindua sp.]|nr:MAG: glycoside hydrolase [Candidatus Scalindua sp.]